MYVFDPVNRSTHFRKQTADKFARWASLLYKYQFVIEHIPCESNVEVDMLCRWVLSESNAPNLSLYGLSPVRPLNQAEFVWPILEQIKKTQ